MTEQIAPGSFSPSPSSESDQSSPASPRSSLPLGSSSSTSFDIFSFPVVRGLLFPAPAPPPKERIHDNYKKHAIEIPALSRSSPSIPCVFFDCASPVLLLYAHGNGCDLFGLLPCLQLYSQRFRCKLLAVEWPGYGLHKGRPSEASLNHTLESAYSYAVGTLGVAANKVFLFGQSIGSGPVTQLASALAKHGQPLGGVILLSPYMNIKSLVRQLAGRVAGSLVATRRWNNLGHMSNIKYPILFLHGCNDTLITASHSEQLFAACVSLHKRLELLDGATHNDFDVEMDLIRPIKQFIDVHSLDTQQEREEMQKTIEEAQNCTIC